LCKSGDTALITMLPSRQWLNQNRRVIFGLGLGLVIVCALFWPQITTKSEAVIGYAKERGICIQCGAQLVNSEQRFFGVKNHRSNMVVAPGFRQGTCNHRVLTFGARVRMLQLFPMKVLWMEGGLSPNSDFFSNTPALEGVLSSIANTNREEFENLLAGLAIACANQKTQILAALPALHLSEPKLLKEQLEAATFRRRIESATNFVNFW
jgi:hypothetical protein